MKTAFYFIRPSQKNNEPPLVKYSTMDALLVEIEKANAEDFDYLKISGLSVENVQDLMHDYFFDLNCTGCGVCIVRWRGYSRWVAYENDQPVFATSEGSATDSPPMKGHIVTGAEKIYEDWRKVRF